MSSLAKRVIMPRDEPHSAEEVRPEELRLLEAMLFASAEPLDETALAARLPAGVDLPAALTRLQEDYAIRGVNLVRIGGKWTFRTASDLSWLLSKETIETRKLSRAAIETLAIIAYHQPVTRTEIEEIRGVSTSKGSVDVLLETGWIRPRGDLDHRLIVIIILQSLPRMDARGSVEKMRQLRQGDWMAFIEAARRPRRSSACPRAPREVSRRPRGIRDLPSPSCPPGAPRG